MCSSPPRCDLIGNTQRIGDDGQCRVDRTYRREKTGVGNVQVIEFLGLAVEVDNGRRRIGTEAGGSRLVCSSADRDILAEVKAAFEQHRMGAGTTENLLELFLESLVCLHIAVSNLQDHASAVIANPVLRTRQIFAR